MLSCGSRNKCIMKLGCRRIAGITCPGRGAAGADIVIFRSRYLSRTDISYFLVQFLFGPVISQLMVCLPNADLAPTRKLKDMSRLDKFKGSE